VEEVARRLLDRWSASLVEAATWKVVADAAACGHLLLDLATVTLDRFLPLALLPPEALPIVPDPLPDTLPPATVHEEPEASRVTSALPPQNGVPGAAHP
jgi:hypothetical protein